MMERERPDIENTGDEAFRPFANTGKRRRRARHRFPTWSACEIHSPWEDELRARPLDWNNRNWKQATDAALLLPQPGFSTRETSTLLPLKQFRISSKLPLGCQLARKPHAERRISVEGLRKSRSIAIKRHIHLYLSTQRNERASFPPTGEVSVNMHVVYQLQGSLFWLARCIITLELSMEGRECAAGIGRVLWWFTKVRLGGFFV